MIFTSLGMIYMVVYMISSTPYNIIEVMRNEQLAGLVCISSAKRKNQTWADTARFSGAIEYERPYNH